MDALEEDTDTRKLFLEQGNLEEAKAKEIAEYLDAKNKEVIHPSSLLIFLLFSLLPSDILI